MSPEGHQAPPLKSDAQTTDDAKRDAASDGKSDVAPKKADGGMGGYVVSPNTGDT